MNRRNNHHQKEKVQMQLFYLGDLHIKLINDRAILKNFQVKGMAGRLTPRRNRIRNCSTLSLLVVSRIITGLHCRAFGGFSTGFGGFSTGFGGFSTGFGGFSTGFGGFSTGFGDFSTGFGDFSTGFEERGRA